MLEIQGNKAKSKITLDTDFDIFVIENTLNHETKVFRDITTSRDGYLYHEALINFSDLELGEYKYTAYLNDEKVQSGLLILRVFEESEEPVQKVSWDIERKVITYSD